MPSGGGGSEAATCGPGTHCEETCYATPCTPDGVCGPPVCEIECVPDGGPGSCTGDVWCDAIPPMCPVNTVPGISGGCWTGSCIPVWQCEQTSCETLATEDACTARPDCTAL